MRILVLFSNPMNTSRLRLDKEDRVIDDLVRHVKIDDGIEIVRRHATSRDDLIDLIGEGDFEIIHFSGHGSPDGIYLDTSDNVEGILIGLDELEFILRHRAQPGLRLLMFMSCYSSAAIEKLIPHSPYIITVDGPIDDDETILFVRHFYYSYLRQRSIQRAFDEAGLHLTARNQEMAVRAVLTNRATHNSEGRLILRAAIHYFPDVMSIDLSSVEHYLDTLDISREQILTLLSRKIRVHGWIFAVPRESAVLPIGATLLGDFSWNTAANFIKCNRLYQIRDDVDPTHWKEWSWILVVYNDLCSMEYRSPDWTGSSTSRGDLITKGLDTFTSCIPSFRHRVAILVQMGFREAERSCALAESYLDLAIKKAETEEWPMVVAYLESALTSIHDMINCTLPGIVS